MPASIQVKTLVLSATGVVVLALCGMFGFIMGRTTAPMETYGKNSLQIGTLRLQVAGDLQQCENAVTTAMEKIKFVVNHNYHPIAGHLSTLFFWYANGVDTPNGHLPFAVAAVFCDADNHQAQVVIADHIYYHHDIIAELQDNIK